MTEQSSSRTGRKSQNNFRVLITGAGGPGAPGIIKSLRLAKNIRIIGVDMRKDAVGSILADEFAVIPEAKNKGYIQSLLKVAKKFKVNVILPTNTAELITLAKNKDKFERAGIKVSISDAKNLKIANNKYLLMEAVKQIVPLPAFYLIKSEEELEEAARELNYPYSKICIKPPVSNGQRGFRILDENADK